MIIADFSISLGGSIVVFLFLGAVMIGLAVLFYRFTLPPLPSKTRTTLSLLRSVTLLLLIAILFEPIARLVRHDEQRPALAVLIDNSQSMTIKDAASDLQKQFEASLGADFLRRLPSGTLVRYYPFSSKLQGTGDVLFDSLAFNGEATNLSEAMINLKSLLSKENIQSALVVSDGNYTVGKNPLYDAEALGIPVFTLGVGDTNEQKDIVIAKIATNTIAYAGTRTPVDVTIRSSGYNGERLEVALNEGSTVLDRTTISLQQTIRQYTTRMHFVPKEEGMKKLSITVSSLPGELTERNNSRTLFIKVLKSKLNILMFAGAPSPDVSSIRQALTEDEHFNIRTFIQKANDEFYEGSFPQSALDSADCILLIGFPSSASGNATVQRLHDGTIQRKKPILYVNGKSTDYNKLQGLEKLLPFTWSGVNPPELLVIPSIEDRYKHHTLIELESKFTSEDWQQLPPIFKAQTSFQGKPGSDILASVVLQNIKLNEPLIILRNIFGQKSFAITGYGIWRWRLLAEGNVQTEPFLPALLSNTVRWLTTTEDNKRVRIIPIKEAFTTAEEVGFSGQVYDDQLRPVDNAEVVVHMELGGQKIPVALTALGNGLYEGTIAGLTDGDYTFTGKAVRNGASLGEDKGRFSVGSVNIEFIETRMNKQLLEQLAYRTGGTYQSLNNADAIAEELSEKTFETKELTQASEIELWNWEYLAVIVILAFSVEWFLRKRNGML